MIITSLYTLYNVISSPFDGELAWLLLDIVSIYVCTFYCVPYNIVAL